MTKKLLSEYNKKRHFHKTSEPPGKLKSKKNKSLIFVIQKHAASHLHYDFRLEWNGVLKSWAVPKGPSLNPENKRLAAHVEDHPYNYKDFEGIIPKGEYGGGTVLLWDQGFWMPEEDPETSYQKGKIKFKLFGKKLKGGWVLLKMRSKEKDSKNWLLIKERDEEASSIDILETKPKSVSTHRHLKQIEEQADQIWKSHKAHRKSSDFSKKKVKIENKINNKEKSHFPAFIKPQLATLNSTVPKGKEWVHEVKFDGYRAISRIENVEVHILTRSQKDWTNRFPSIAEELTDLKVKQAILDGEIVSLLPNGISNFQALQNSLSEKRDDRLYYYVFDLLYLNGTNLCTFSLKNRRELLKELLSSLSSNSLIRLSENIKENAGKFFQKACQLGLEGIISKRTDSLYESGVRTDKWLKIKCLKRQEFVICGFTSPAGKRKNFGSLILGIYNSSHHLIYSGLVGTGFSVATLHELHEKLLKLIQKNPTIALPSGLRLGKITWVQPKLVAEVQFTEWTRDNVLRHPSFQGLREDKSPEDIVREIVKNETIEENKMSKISHKRSSIKDSENSVANVLLTHPNKFLYPVKKITKLKLAHYYDEIADYILPHLKNRPLSLVRCPEGAGKQCFYQKHLAENLVGNLETISIESKEERALYPMANDRAGLISLVQIGVLEIHPWGSTIKDLEHPDRIIFDLDPDLGLPWKKMIDTAKLLRLLLKELELQSFVKTTGGKGLHVVIPFSKKQGWKEVKSFSKAVAQLLVKDDPKSYTVELLKVKRKGRIFLDYLRNDRGSTAVAPYSSRAKEKPTVSTPLFWEEVEVKMKSDHFDIENLPKRLRSLKEDPWKDFFNINQSLANALKKPWIKSSRD